MSLKIAIFPYSFFVSQHDFNHYAKRHKMVITKNQMALRVRLPANHFTAGVNALVKFEALPRVNEFLKKKTDMY